MWYKRYKSGEYEYKLAYLLFEWGINTKIKISWYRPSSLWLKLHALTTVPVEMWTYIQAWKLVFRSNTFELMKTFQKIWYQPISARKWTSKKSYPQKRNWKFPRFPSFRFWPYTEIENSKIFTTLLNSKECVLLEEVGNFQGFSSFWFWRLYWNRKLRKFGHIYNTCKFKGMSFTWGSWKFPRFPSFRFWPLYWNRKLRKLGNIYNTCKFQGMSFTWGSWKFPRFPSFQFWPLYWNRKLGKLGNIYNTCKFQGMCFTWGSWTFPGFPSVRFWPLYWNRKLRKLRNFVLSEFVLFEEVRKQQPPEVLCKKRCS